MYIIICLKVTKIFPVPCTSRLLYNVTHNISELCRPGAIDVVRRDGCRLARWMAPVTGGSQVRVCHVQKTFRGSNQP